MSAWKAGKVQWFDDENGKGMIIDTENGESFFVNYRSIQSKEERKSLKKGSEVKYQSRPTKYTNIITRVKEVTQ